jgi:hypothetical protein
MVDRDVPAACQWFPGTSSVRLITVSLPELAPHL